jgi:hypothetical protein
VTCQFCGASSFIQTQKRPVTQYVHAHAMPVIHVPRVQRGCAPAVGLLAALAGVGAAIAGVVVSYISTTPATAVTTPQVEAPQAVPAAPTSDATPGQPSRPLVEEDYFADATKAKARYEAVLGKPVMARQLVLYQYYALLEAQNPKKREHVDNYKLWANKVERPTPVRLGSDKSQLGQSLFSFDGVDFSLVRGLLQRALAELKIEEGKVTHVFLERDATSDRREPTWRVYVNGTRESGFVEFSVRGEKLRAVR